VSTAPQHNTFAKSQPSEKVVEQLLSRGGHVFDRLQDGRIRGPGVIFESEDDWLQMFELQEENDEEDDILYE
jgi:hypothetical protein